MIRVGIAGASGYTGLELIRLLSRHPQIVVQRIYSKSQVGITISEIYPHLTGVVDLTLDELTQANVSDIDLLFLALPHGQAQHYYEWLSRLPIRVIDLSADFRLNDPALFEKYYGESHKHPELLGTVPLGLPELFRDAVQLASFVACPGCYATSVMLGLAPLAHLNLLSRPVIADSKSGVSGAGRTIKESNLFCEINESFMAYGTGTHRHTAEMEMVLGTKVLFSPHLVPMNRGILSTMYIDSGLSEQDLRDIYTDFYSSQPFITLLESPRTPSTKMVSGTNSCFIGFKALPELGKVVIISAIDNLIKGASGQAIQCMNIMYGWDETMGLPRVAHYF